LSDDAWDRRDGHRRRAQRLVRHRRRRGYGDRLLCQRYACPTPVAARDRDRLVAGRGGAVPTAPPGRGAAAVGGADAVAARRARLCPVVAARPAAMTDFDHAAIDEILHSRVRLAIVAFLARARTP